MKVKDLIKDLSKLNPELEIFSQHHEFCSYYEHLNKPQEIEVFLYKSRYGCKKTRWDTEDNLFITDEEHNTCFDHDNVLDKKKVIVLDTYLTQNEINTNVRRNKEHKKACERCETCKNWVLNILNDGATGDWSYCGLDNIIDLQCVDYEKKI